MEEETEFLAVRELAQQLDILLDSQQKLGLAVKDIPGAERAKAMEWQDQLICGCVKLGRKIDPALALALFIQNQLWNENDAYTLWQLNPWCSMGSFNYSFEQYACARMDREWVTIANWLTTVKTHFIGNYAPEEVALVDPRTGRILLEQLGDGTVPVVRKWDPFSIDFSKLLLVNRAARDNELREEGYGLLMNEKTRWADMRDFIHNLKPWREREVKEGRLRFFIQNNLLWCGDGERSAILASLELDSEDMLVRQGVARLIRALSITIK